MTSVLTFGFLWWSSEHPDDRETWYSNVLTTWPSSNHFDLFECLVCRVPFQWRAVAAAHPIALVVSHYLNKLKSFFGFTNIWHLRVWLERDMIDMSTCHTIQLGSRNVFTNLETCEYCPGKQQSQWLFDKEWHGTLFPILVLFISCFWS